MSEDVKVACPECETGEPVDRRSFMKAMGGSAVLLTGLNAATPKSHAQETAAPPARAAKPAEELIRELHSTLSAEQKTRIVLPWDHKEGNSEYFTRHRMFNSTLPGRPSIGTAYTMAQQDLVDRIFKAISSGEEGHRKLSRNGTYDGSGSFRGMGAYFFGEPTNDRPYALVFMGHHLTVRCDANSEPNTAFGGPIYYGHSPNGYSEANAFSFQTRSVLRVLDALSGEQRTKAIVSGNPGEHEASVQLRRTHPGLVSSDLSADQKRLVETVLRDLLSPFRREDADEVMEIVRRNGGMDRMHLAFYRDSRMNDAQQWHFWRLEGPGFVWNFRVLPHVHTYVQIRAIA